MSTDNIIVLTDESGANVEFEFLDLIQYMEQEYVVLLPIDGRESEACEVVILLMESIDSNSESFTSVEDDETLQAVFELFKNKFKDSFDFED